MIAANVISTSPRCIAFTGNKCLASGDLTAVAQKAKSALDQGERSPLVIFDEVTSRLVEIDFRGTVEEVLEKLPKLNLPSESISSESSEKRGPGRPKLGVVAREITLLPRHWDWLNQQPGGASVALRRLVEEARRSHAPKEQARQSMESVHRFMYAMAGDLPGFEEASRSFYAKKYDQLDQTITSWPDGIRDHLRKLIATVIRDEAVLS